MNNTIRMLITVDTEEEGIWDGEYSRSGSPVRNIEGIHRFQELCDEFQFKPTYLIDYSVCSTPESADIFGPIQSENRGEIGGHLHPWSTPPFEEEINERNTFMCNLPEDLVARKIDTLIEAHQNRFGCRPYAFRSGRWGFNNNVARILCEKGFLVDSSIRPFTDYTSDGIPLYVSELPEWYWLDPEDIFSSSGPDRRILEIPASTGFNRTPFARAFKIREQLKHPVLQKLRLVGILYHLNLLKNLSLSPELDTLQNMMSCARMFVSCGRNVFNVFLHSSSLTAGFSPYVTSDAQLETYLDHIRQFFEFVRRHWSVEGLTLTEFRAVAERST